MKRVNTDRAVFRQGNEDNEGLRFIRLKRAPMGGSYAPRIVQDLPRVYRIGQEGSMRVYSARSSHRSPWARRRRETTAENAVSPRNNRDGTSSKGLALA